MKIIFGTINNHQILCYSIDSQFNNEIIVHYQTEDFYSITTDIMRDPQEDVVNHITLNILIMYFVVQ